MSSDLARWYHSMTFVYADEWDDTIRVLGKYLVLDPEVYDITDTSLNFKSERVQIKNGSIVSDKMKHGSINTWDDWHLIPTSRPVFQQGSTKTVYIDVPGADGHIDLTESLTGYPLYSNREGSLEFIVANGWRHSWAEGFSRFANWLHGKKLRVILDDDPEYFYEGRFQLNEWNSNNDGTWSNITIDYNLKPYKFSIYMSTDNWLWDPFNFQTGFTYNGKSFEINGETTITVNNNYMHVVPTFEITDTTDPMWLIELNGNVAEVIPDFTDSTTFSFKNPMLELLQGQNSIVIKPYKYTEVTPVGSENPSNLGWYEKDSNIS